MEKCYRKRTPQLELLVISEYQNDPKLGTRGLAEKIGISRSLIKQILKDNNIERKRPGLKQDFKEENINLIITLFKGCKNLKQIKDETGFSDRQIRKVIRENFKSEFSVYPDFNCVKIESAKDRIIDMYLNRRITIAQIAKEFAVSYTAVRRFLAINWNIKAPLRRPSFGRGICGRYKGQYFRSLLELSFIISFLEKSNFKYESGEQEMYAIPYVDENNKNRNYFPDFIADTEKKKTIFECKPKTLWESPRVAAKTKAAKKYARKNNMNYKLIDCPLCLKEIKEKFEQNDLSFNKYNLPKFIKFLNNPKNYPLKSS